MWCRLAKSSLRAVALTVRLLSYPRDLAKVPGFCMCRPEPPFVFSVSERVYSIKCSRAETTMPQGRLEWRDERLWKSF